MALQKTQKKASPNEVRKALIKMRHDMIADLRCTLPEGTIDRKSWKKKQDALEKQLKEKYPMWESFNKKSLANVDRKSPLSFTPEEKKIENSSLYKKYLNSFGEESNERYEKCQEWGKKISQLPITWDEKGRMREDTSSLTKKEQEALKNAEMTIWNKRTDFFGDKAKDHWAKNFPVLTFDSDFYSVLEGYWGYGDTYNKPTCRLDYRLGKLGCSYEPHNYGVWTTFCDSNKSNLKGKAYKERFIKNNPHCKPFVSDLR